MREGASEAAAPSGLGELVSQLAADAREVASAEAALVKAKALAGVARYKAAAIFFGAAGVLALAALIALLVGLILTLAPRVGPGLATVIVVGLVIVLAGILGMIGRSKLSGPSA